MEKKIEEIKRKAREILIDRFEKARADLAKKYETCDGDMLDKLINRKEKAVLEMESQEVYSELVRKLYSAA